LIHGVELISGKVLAQVRADVFRQNRPVLAADAPDIGQCIVRQIFIAVLIEDEIELQESF
jgi:hypothetical protein